MVEKEKRCTVMFFRICMCLKKIKSLQAVLDDASVVLVHSKSSHRNTHCERTSRCASFLRKGSLTVEAALAFPLFLFGAIALLHLFLLTQLQAEVGRALTDTARELAQDACLTDLEEGLSASVISSVYGKYQVNDYLKGKAVTAILEGGSGGVSLLGSSWDPQDSKLTLRASYRVILPPGIPGFHKVRITQVKVVRGWTGFGGRQHTGGETGEEVVYITDYGTVYHCSLDCRHLKLSVRQARLEETASLRNEGGGKYYPCERCWKSGSSMVFLTEDGNRYHESLNCPGLSRGIHTVLRSEAGGRPPCSVCGR